MNFSLKNIECWLHLGVGEEERLNLQKILISIKFQANTEKAQKSDDIQDTTDYFQIYQSTKKVAQAKTYKLIESLHHDLYQEITKNFPEISDLQVMIKKKPFSDATITIS